MDLWRYIKDEDDKDGEDRGWLDFVQWTGPSPTQYPEDWDIITYKYDASGRRIQKTAKVASARYIYDGGNVIAEYDGVNNLLRKYVHGAGVDEPVCMIDVTDSNETYYYHFDGLGSVVALSDSEGDTVQTYEYSAFGQVAVSDPDFISNPYMFTGRRFDIETGLYYYRARYYNPHIGRFMQTDPVGYSAGINLYTYCRNNPLAFVDPSGLEGIRDLKEDELLVGFIFPTHGQQMRPQRIWGLVGEWDASDVAIWLHCELSEVTVYNVEVYQFGRRYVLPVYYEENKGYETTIQERTNDGEVVNINSRAAAEVINAVNTMRDARRTSPVNYEWEPSLASRAAMRAACRILKVVSAITPGGAGGKTAAVTHETGWCNRMLTSCKVHCEDVDQIYVGECLIKCDDEHRACLGRASLGKCWFQFRISG